MKVCFSQLPWLQFGFVCEAGIKVGVGAVEEKPPLRPGCGSRSSLLTQIP